MNLAEQQPPGTATAKRMLSFLCGASAAAHVNLSTSVLVALAWYTSSMLVFHSDKTKGKETHGLSVIVQGGFMVLPYACASFYASVEVSVYTGSLFLIALSIAVGKHHAVMTTRMISSHVWVSGFSLFALITHLNAMPLPAYVSIMWSVFRPVLIVAFTASILGGVDFTEQQPSELIADSWGHAMVLWCISRMTERFD